jgi:hypothetical protein
MKKEKLHALKGVFMVLVLINILIMSYPLFPRSAMRAVFPIFAFLAFASMLLGIALILLTLRAKVKGVLKTFLVIFGASSVGFLAFSLLHNFFYAFAQVSANIAFLRIVFEILHVGSLIAVFTLCPLGVIVGAGGSLILFRKK